MNPDHPAPNNPESASDITDVSASLTLEQQQVASHQQGHARVIAVAGAGKTTTLIHFIHNQLQAKVSPRRMLVLMYNKSAQQDFQHKLRRHVPGRVLPEIRTFHSLGWRIYQRLIQDGVLPAYQGKLLSEGEMDGQIWRMLQQLSDGDVRQDVLSQRKKWVEPAMAFIDRVKTGLDSPEQVFEAMDMPSECSVFVDVFTLFERWRKEQRRISYADMIYDPVKCFEEHPEVAERFGGHMQWILVDEYQDINAIQQRLIEVIHGQRGAVMVIGDPDQTIYEFRGSKPEYIVSGFEQRFGHEQGLRVEQYQLPHTFRYGHGLSLLANHLIQHNQERDPVLCLSHNSTPPTRIHRHEASSTQEAQKVVALIKQAAAETELENIAVIHRLWALCAPIELELLRIGMPYQLHHSRSVLERQELQIFWLLLEVAAGEFSIRDVPQRREAWLLLLSTPYPKIKRDVLEQLADRLSHETDRLGVALQQAIPKSLSRWQKQQLEVRAELLDSAEFHARLPVQRLLSAYVEQTELEQGIEDSAFSRQQVEDRLQTIRAFVRFMASTRLPANEALAYLRDLQTQRLAQQAKASAGSGESTSSQQKCGVQLTSIHKSKGLEWHTVIIPGLNGHYFPYQPEGEFASPPSEESERRLLYVAMTRARSHLHLIVPPDVSPGREADVDTIDRELPSCFETELNIRNCQRITRALEQGNASVTHSGKPTEWLNRYFQQSGAGQDLKVNITPSDNHRAGALSVKSTSGGTGKPAPERLRAGSFRSAKMRNAEVLKVSNHRSDPEKRVQHEIFGEGRLVEEQERYWVIHFDADKSPRTLDKSMSEAMINWL
ncbi:MAG: DNA/RNA helicase [Oceanospirillaceae bacterium]|nr:DNA/RNA helicase [Oceanospirillaceae bacterium]